MLRLDVRLTLSDRHSVILRRDSVFVASLVGVVSCRFYLSILNS